MGFPIAFFPLPSQVISSEIEGICILIKTKL